MFAMYQVINLLPVSVAVAQCQFQFRLSRLVCLLKKRLLSIPTLLWLTAIKTSACYHNQLLLLNAVLPPLQIF